MSASSVFPSTLRLLNVHAHPDDESSKGAATMAKYADEGVEVMVVTCTGGERGTILNPALLDDADLLRDLPSRRRREMAEAARILGVRHEWLGFEDSGLPEGDPLPPLPEGCFALQDVEEAAGRLVKVIREFRPHVITTYDEHGGYPHPDHVMCHQVTVAAFHAASNTMAWPEHGPPWQVAKLYYHMSFHRRRYAALDQAMHDHGLEPKHPPFVDDDTYSDGRLTTFIECSEFFPVRDAALRAHATQVDPEGPWFGIPLAVQQKGWPTEDFQLVISKVPTIIPEDDLFTGLRAPLVAPEFYI
ncbi:MAG TPA: mycothiol conjugate amidase Mca [Arachnia sp.]|nr:mycothiol conjugate amidase Mca [Arachnia sp.]HMT85543.1 mycothiol conjugate amidase Mca [Arachnia sp.]